MNSFARHLKSLALAALAAAAALQASLHAQGTAITYQGRLDSGGAPVTGLYDLQFNLYSVATGGSALTSAVSLNAQPVTNGLFTVTLDFGNQFPGADRWLEISARTNGAVTFNVLSPRQKITPTPYAITAGNVSGTVPASQLTGTIAAGRLPANVVTNLASGVSLTGAFTGTLTGNGSGLTSVPAGQLTGSIADARLSANVALRTGGNTFTGNQIISSGSVGIGIASPAARLHVNGDFLRVEGAGGQAAYLGADIVNADIELGSLNPGVQAVTLWNAGAGGLMSLNAQDLNFSGALNGNSMANLALRTGGNDFTGNQTLAGGGWSFLDANASLTYPAVSGASSPMIHMFASGTGNADRMVIAHSPAYPDWGLQYQDSPDQFNFLGGGFPVMSVGLDSTLVGIGTRTPQSRLDVVGEIRGNGVTSTTANGNGVQGIAATANGVQGNSSSSSASGVYGENNSGGGFGVAGRAFGAGHGVYGENLNSAGWAGTFNGNLLYSGTQFKLDVGENFLATIRAADLFLGHSSRRGSPGRALVDFTDTLHLNFGNDWANTYIGGNNVSVCTLTIRGGCDIAEPFKMSENEIPKGAVVIIDENNPGHLKMSSEAHDRRVAGIISGANGVNTGVQLTQEGMFDNGQNVALSGRVYVQADAGHGVIKPGDLLTTSDTPGHAMRVTDHTKAQGAILGKAMTALKDGKGFVLVLVSLQ